MPNIMTIGVGKTAKPDLGPEPESDSLGDFLWAAAYSVQGSDGTKSTQVGTRIGDPR